MIAAAQPKDSPMYIAKALSSHQNRGTQLRFRHFDSVAPSLALMNEHTTSAEAYCRAEKPHACRACRLAPSISSRQTLEVAQRRCNTQAAFGEHRAHMSLHAAGHPAIHEV